MLREHRLTTGAMRDHRLATGAMRKKQSAEVVPGGVQVDRVPGQLGQERVDVPGGQVGVPGIEDAQIGELEVIVPRGTSPRSDPWIRGRGADGVAPTLGRQPSASEITRPALLTV